MNIKSFAQRFSSKRKLDGDEMKDLIAKMGLWLLRGPLNAQEINTYRGIATTVAGAGGNFEEATRYIIEAMLQSPRFIYRMENQRGDGTDWPVGDYELASRLSYILWGGPPDEELMRAAGESKLDQDEVKQQVARLLQDPRAVAQSATFIHEWLDLDRMDNLRPDAKRFPKWNPDLAADMRQETLAFFEEIVWKQKRPMSELLNAQFTYATPRLAAHYGLKPATGEGLSRYELKSVAARGGLLTHGSILTVGGDDASMVTRGLFVLHDMLRGMVKDPPPGTDTTPVPSKPGLSQRIIAEKRVAEKSCGGCHSRFEPLAYGLEKFDGIGAFHEQDEHGNKLREDGAILFPGDAQPTRYNSTAQLMDLLAKSDRVRETITWKITQFALGRPLAPADVPLLESIHQTAWKAGGTYENLITAIVTSDLVLKTRTETHQ